MNIRILSPAFQDLADAVRYYETQSHGLGNAFLDEYEKTILRIRALPEAWTEIRPNLRRCLLRRFPYAVFYSRETDEIIVSCIADLRMNPKKISQMILTRMSVK